MKEKALDRTVWRAGFGRGFGPVVRQTPKRIIYIQSVPGGMCQTSGGCSLCESIPI